MQIDHKACMLQGRGYIVIDRSLPQSLNLNPFHSVLKNPVIVKTKMVMKRRKKPKSNRLRHCDYVHLLYTDYDNNAC